VRAGDKKRRFLRVVRFDASDSHVFARSAEADEIAVSGAFEFSNICTAELSGKLKQAFANGFLGLTSFGRATFVVVSDISEVEYEKMIADLTQHFIDAYGAPSFFEAEKAAREEAAFVTDLCKDNLINTIFAVSRTLDDTGICEEFRIIKPPGEGMHTRIWNVVEDEGVKSG